MIEERKSSSCTQLWQEAGLIPLRIVYYSYLERFGCMPEDVYEMLKGYAYIVITRGF